MRKKIVNTVVYPTILSIALMFIVTFVVIKVMPIFNNLLIGYGIEMPIFTKVVMNTSIWIGNNIFIVSIIFVAICGILYFYIKTEQGQKRFKKAILKLKAFNSIEKRIIAINFSKSVASLLRSGMILSNAFELSNNLIKHTVFNDKFEKVKDDITNGEDFYYAIQELDIYPMFYAKMLSIGNKTGALDDAFSEVASMLQEDLEEDIERVQKLFEPLLMLFLGGIVTIILISVALPMINILENII